LKLISVAGLYIVIFSYRIYIQLEIKDNQMMSLDRLNSIGMWRGSIPSDQRFSVSLKARMI
jgi:hypothetical protein